MNFTDETGFASSDPIGRLKECFPFYFEFK